MTKIINLRKLVALDMVLNGRRFILGEFAFGVIAPLFFVALFYRPALTGGGRPAWETVFAWWLIGMTVNYIPLLIYAVQIARAGTVEAEGRPEVPHARRYTLQQAIVLIPFVVAVLALIQEWQRRR